jgi:hypothetical protein
MIFAWDFLAEPIWSWAIGGSASRELLSARIVVLRLLLPIRFKTRSLYALLRELTRSRDVRIEWTIAEAEEAVDTLLRRNRWTRTTCLYRTLVRYVLLREAGLDVRFVMGVVEREDLIAHAWLELGGQPFGETLPHAYQRTLRYP